MTSPFSILILENEPFMINQIAGLMVDYHCVIHHRSDLLSGIELASSTAINLIIIDSIFERDAAWKVVERIRSVDLLTNTLIYACSDPAKDNTEFILTNDSYTQVYRKPVPDFALESAIFINQTN